MADDNPHTTPFSTITKEPGKKGTVLAEKVTDPRVTMSEESEEEEPEVTITPDFVKNNKEVLRAKLAELEHQEKLEKLKARLTYEDDEPEGTSKKLGYSEELWEKIFKVMEESKGLKKSGGETNDGDDPLLKPYQPTNSTDLSKFTRRIAEAPLPEKLKLPANVGRYDGTEDPDDHLHAFAGLGEWEAVKNPNEILHIRRRDDEKVEQFMERFITESMQIQGVPKVMKISSFINGVRQPQLCEKLGEDFPTTFDSLMDKVRAFVRGKDTSFRAREWELKKSGSYRPKETQEIARSGPYTGKCKWEKKRSYVDMIRRRTDNEYEMRKRTKLTEDEGYPWMETSITFLSLKPWETQEAPLNISANIADVTERWEDDTTAMVGFSGEVTHSLGKITLPFTVGEGVKWRTVYLTFYIVKAPSKYNAILGRPGIRALRALVSTVHGAIKFPTPTGVATVSSFTEIIATVSKKEERCKTEEEEWVLDDRFPNATVKQYLAKAKSLQQQFVECQVIHINRSQNHKADALSKLASAAFSKLGSEIRIDVLTKPSIEGELENTRGNTNNFMGGID
ncbi:hypothetical protein E3N88_35612 [Mikania micrantha]|uniref:RNase H type-1 domain-containing protein n=1 Tax=Mikania micrantha TaxID=192012 RepID=A0A5N6M1S9_9ASTR|nr:hypothetical protein E3N88_35612 [Mikania micrantha]